MGKRNSTLTRVKPLFDLINSDTNKLNCVLELFDKNLRIEQNSLIEIRYGKNEKKIPPPKTLLIWMHNHLEELNKLYNNGINSVNSKTYLKRVQLFNGDTQIKEEAINQINTNLQLPKSAWYIFEGYTCPDIYIETTDCIFIGEAKRTEKDITTKTKWLNQRDQLIRHIDSLLDQDKKIYSFYILEEKEYKKGIYKNSMELYSNEDYFKQNLRHRDNKSIERAFESFIGFVFWEDIATSFNICFLDTINVKISLFYKAPQIKL